MTYFYATIALLLAAMCAATANAQLGGDRNQAAVLDLTGAADENALIGLHQEMNIGRGDLNASGAVEFDDFLRFSRKLGNSVGGYINGDFNSDGKTDIGDFGILSQNFGKIGYQPELPSRRANANLGLWRDDSGQLLVSSASSREVGGFEIDFGNATYTVPAGRINAQPFAFAIPSRGGNAVGWGSLGNSVTLDGDFQTHHTTDSTDLTIRWFEPGSYDYYSLKYGEGDALTNRLIPSEPPTIVDPLPDPPDVGTPSSGDTFDPRFNEVANLTELIALHQEADIQRGDFDANGEVTFADFLILAGNYKSSVDVYSQGDGNLDGLVDLEDFALVSTNFGQVGYTPDPPVAGRVELTATINADNKVVISAAEAAELGGILIESSNSGLTGTDNESAAPFQFFLEKTNASVTLGNLGTGILIDDPIVTGVFADPGAELSLQWFQRGSYEVFSSDVAASALASLVGDIDGNGEVQFADFLILANNFGQQVEPGAVGDIDADGIVGFTDFLKLSDNFGATSAADVSTVPEPIASDMLAVLGSIALLVRRRRQA